MKPRNRARVTALLLAVSTLALAAALIVQCVSIYAFGTSPANLTETGVYQNDVYSRSIVARKLWEISWVFALWLAALVAALLGKGRGREETRVSMAKLPEIRLALLKPRVTPTSAMLGEERKRKRAAIACAVCLAVCGGMACSYLLRLEHFASRDLESVMGAMLLHVAPWVALAFTALMALERLRVQSMERELEQIKNAPGRTPEPPRARKRRGILLAGRAIALVCAIALLIAGTLNGGMYDVLVKAIHICTECIGLG